MKASSKSSSVVGTFAEEGHLRHIVRRGTRKECVAKRCGKAEWINLSS